MDRLDKQVYGLLGETFEIVGTSVSAESSRTRDSRRGAGATFYLVDFYEGR